MQFMCTERNKVQPVLMAANYRAGVTALWEIELVQP